MLTTTTVLRIGSSLSQIRICLEYPMMYVVHNWASEASPTLGCSIEISRVIYIYMCMCLSYVKVTA